MDTIIGTTAIWGGEQHVAIADADRSRHTWCIGKTGAGKTTLIRNMIIQDLERGHGVGVIDPHGDLAHELLEYIPRHRTREVVYFAPADLERPIGFNVLERVPPDRRPLVASNVVAAFKHSWSDSWGPRLEYLLYNTVAALLDYPSGTLVGISRMLVSEEFRADVLQHVQDPLVRQYWEHEFAGYSEKMLPEVVSPLQNKVGQLLSAPSIRNIVGQPRSTIDLSKTMNDGRIFIANLSKGQIGEDKANLIGSFLVTRFYLSALERAAIPEQERRQFNLHIDEFQNFTTSSFDSILSESRKFKLCLSLANQYLAQAEERVRASLLGNVATIIAFRVGSSDAEVLAGEFHPYQPNALTELGRHEVLVKLCRDGMTSEPIIARTLPPVGRPSGRRERVLRASRERFGRSRRKVEERINGWLAE